ncbi:hypothetical protein PENTCL1PPCAC_28209, partial [Pristionchus entomophagus]
VVLQGQFLCLSGLSYIRVATSLVHHENFVHSRCIFLEVYAGVGIPEGGRCTDDRLHLLADSGRERERNGGRSPDGRG